jgi:hypothetical protein
MKKILGFLLLTQSCLAQISFFNMPNPDMLPDVGYLYTEYDRYQTYRGENSVNASVFRVSAQATKFLEVGTNWWFNSDNPSDPNRVVVATKWKINLVNQEKFTMSVSPGSWTSFYFEDEVPIRNIFYTFTGLTFKEGDNGYTRLMIGGYGRFIRKTESQYGIIAGIEQRFTKNFEVVADYFQGSGEGFGLAAGIVYYAMDNGTNLPLYLAHQWDNDSPKNNLILFEIGYFLRGWSKRK